MHAYKSVTHVNRPPYCIVYKCRPFKSSSCQVVLLRLIDLGSVEAVYSALINPANACWLQPSNPRK